MVITLGVFRSSTAQDTQIVIPYYSLGIIYDASTNQPIGSGFVFKDPNIVVTARHVLVDVETGRRRKLTFMPIKGMVAGPTIPSLPLRPIKDDERADIAVLRIDGPSPCKEALQPSIVEFKIGDNVLYGGFEPRAGRFNDTASPITDIYSQNGIRFFQIVGEADHGWSGGPVFGSGAQVIGIILRGKPSGDGTNNIFDVVSVEHVPTP